MSTEAITWALSVHGLSPRAKLVLIGLADSCDKATWTCYPSRKSLADVGDCSLDTVDRAMKELATAGHIKVDGRMRDRGGQSSNLYTVHPSRKCAAPVQSRKIAEEGAAKPQRPPPAEMPRGEPQGYAAGGAAQAAAPYEPRTEPLDEPIASLRSASPRASKSRIDKQAPFDERARAIAAAKGFANGSAEPVWENFRDYHVARGTRFVDWDAAWRNWLANQPRFAVHAPSRAPRPDASAIIARVAAEVLPK